MRALAPLLLVLLLAACSTAPPRMLPPGPPPLERDGHEGVPSIDPLSVPDATPRIEPIPPGGPNKPYEIDGQRFEPIPHDRAFKERGLASWYGRKFHGRSTANGETYNMYAMSAAHKLLPLPSYVRVRNPANGREVIVRVNDRGPFVRGRVIDLSYTAAAKLDLLGGVAPVEIERITFDEIRSGRWQESAPSAEPAQATADAGSEVNAASRGFWLQLGAFRALAGAEALLADLADRFPDIAVKLTLFRDRGLHRVQLGPLLDRELAQRIARRLRDEGDLEALLISR